MVMLIPSSPPDPFQRAADTLAVITALVGSLSTIYTVLVDLTRNRNRPKEHSPLKFLRVQHQPVELQDWQRRKTIYLTIGIGLFVALTAYSLVLFLLFPPEAGDLGRIGFYVVFVIVVLFNILLFFYLYAKLGKTPKDARTFFFQYATVEVEGALETIFAECLRAVKNLNAYALEFDFSRRYLEATVGASLKSFGGVLCVQIEQKDDTRSIVRVNVERRFSLSALTNSSWTIAYFLEQFLGK
ncbi:MAG TPA: hypothetical protein VKB35_09325 [Ktedonobacteraceae bacterium]|nr:hypothetical protein [Ktedonobacteraceae bacterium]